MIAQEYFVSDEPLARSLRRSRRRRCSARATASCRRSGSAPSCAFVDRLEHDHIEDGRWASPLTNTPRIQVFSPNYCAHNEHEVGRGRWPGTAARAPRGLQDACRAAAARAGDAGLGRAVRRAGRRDLRRPRRARSGRRRGLAGDGRRRPTAHKYLLGPGRRGRARRRRSGAGARGDDLGLGVRSRVAGRGGGGARSTAARRASSRAARCWATSAPISALAVAAGARGQRRLRRPGPAYRAPRILVHAADRSDRQRVRLRDRRGDGRRAGRAADAAPQRHRARSALRAQRARRGRGAAARPAARARANVCDDGSHGACCTTAWTERVRRPPPTAARRPTAPRRSTAARSPRSTTGWIEAPVRRQLHLRVVAAAEPPVRQRDEGARLVRDLAGNAPADRSRSRRASATTCAGIASRPSRRLARPGRA